VVECSAAAALKQRGEGMGRGESGPMPGGGGKWGRGGGLARLALELRVGRALRCRVTRIVALRVEETGEGKALTGGLGLQCPGLNPFKPMK
jgi:hypothetical protein